MASKDELQAAGGAGAGLGGAIGGIIGGNAAKMDRAKQKEMINNAINEYKRIGYPPDYARELVLQQYEQQGILTPELEQMIMVPESEVGLIQEDAAPIEAQKQALAMMQQRAQVGLSGEDRAALNTIRQQTQQDVQAKNAQILNQMRAQGMGGSGAALIAQLQNSQSGADRASNESMQQMGQAQERALQALSQSGQMAGNVRTQNLNTQQLKAGALDERNKFLAQNSVSRQQANVQALNQAQANNLAQKQSIANQNVAMANAEKERQATAQREQYQDKLSYAAGITGQQQKAADYYGASGTAKAKAGASAGAGLGGAIGSVAMLASDENLKENIDYTDEDVNRFLESLKLKKRTF